VVTADNDTDDTGSKPKRGLFGRLFGPLRIRLEIFLFGTAGELEQDIVLPDEALERPAPVQVWAKTRAKANWDLVVSEDKNTDDTGGRPKRGLFRRLFGRGEAQAVPAEPEPDVFESAAEPEQGFAPPDEAQALEPEFADGEEIFAAPDTPEQKQNWWARLRVGLSRSSHSIGEGLAAIFTQRKLDAAMLEELEDVLIRADLGVATSARIASAIGDIRYNKDISVGEVKEILAAEVERVLAPCALPLEIDPNRQPFVILVVGVNGSGKTTTIGKLAAQFLAKGHKVMLAAGDTFRAAAIEQLQIWGERLGCPVIARKQGSDASGLAFDAIKDAQESGASVLLMDTAGRLQNRAELMAELDKIIRVMRKVDESAPHAVLLVLDATVGQNALSQVDIFERVAGVTGLVMTKLDGTARGGILVAIAEQFELPIHYIGVGEGVNDLESFEARDFARAIAGLGD
jgi:fused signal recognition particle receptor